ncbi:MAG: SecD/SecF family protein translocase subunit [Microthrixaceae bacterium]
MEQPEFQRDQIQISGNFNEQSAKDLALALKYGSLPLELRPQTVQTVSATLGQGALRSGIVAGLAGLAIVTAWMVFYYRLLGAITIGSLLITAGILWAVVGLLGHTSGLALSLAGIVGIIVSIGVSLDSSILYFESFKEEVLHGRGVRSAVDRSFGQAFGTIVKADSSSLIGAIILYVLSVGPVKGFAFYLALTTLIDLLLAYCFIRPATILAAQSKLGDRPALFGIPKPRSGEVRRRGPKRVDDAVAKDAAVPATEGDRG